MPLLAISPAQYSLSRSNELAVALKSASNVDRLYGGHSNVSQEKRKINHSHLIGVNVLHNNVLPSRLSNHHVRC